MRQRRKEIGGGPVKFLAEERGGWDSWSDGWLQVVEVELPNGETVNPYSHESLFERSDGTPLTVEFPSRYRGTIHVEEYDPYKWEKLRLSGFNEEIESGDIEFVG